MASKKVVGFRLSPFIFSLLESKAREMDLSVAEFCRLIVQKYIETNHRSELNKLALKK